MPVLVIPKNTTHFPNIVFHVFSDRNTITLNYDYSRTSGFEEAF